MRCPECGFENPDGFKFCGSCGTELSVSCPNCGAPAQPGFKFCGECGHPLDASAPSAADERPMPSERRRVTVLFADLVGFSTLAEQMDPEELRALMNETFKELTATIEDREGVVEKFIGDAVVAIFGAPVAHEDDPERAVHSALAMREALERRSRSLPSELQIRIGINSGLVVSGGVGDGSQTGVMGDAVNVAARLQQGAASGQIVVSHSVWRRVGQRFEAELVGLLEVKGREGQIEAYRITGASADVAGRRSPFVGRQDETALLDLLWSSAAKGNTHIVSLVGEPGVGKSRFIEEFPQRKGAIDLRITCGSERAFGPFLELVEVILGGLPRDVDDLKGRAAKLGVDEETALLLGALLGLAGAPSAPRMSDDQQKRQVFTGVWHFLLASMRDRPAFIVLEDVHWSDRSSLELLGFLLERFSGIPLLLLLAYRPGFDEVEKTALRSSHTAIQLEPLTPEDSIALAKGFLGATEIPPDLEEVVASRTEGNPFFIEELLQSLTELGSLAVVDGKALLSDADLHVPDTIEGTVMARVDRLDSPERAVLQHASVIGLTFASELLAKLLVDVDVPPSLERLARGQLIVAEGPDRWRFKHALIQDVIYQALLLRQRTELHRRVAEEVEKTYGDDPAYLEVLAEHYSQAKVHEKAARYAVLAGDLAAERVAFPEAQTHYETALRLSSEVDPHGRLEVLRKLGHAAYRASDFTTARTALVEAIDGWKEVGDARRAGEALASLGRIYWSGTGDTVRATEAGREAIDLLEPLGPSPELAQAYVWSSTQRMLEGRLEVAIELATKGLEIAEALDLDGTRSHLLNTLGCCEGQAGDPAGLERIREALVLAERSGEAEAIGRAYVNVPSTLALFQRNREGAETCERGREVMRKLGSPTFETFIAGNQADMLTELGEYEEAERICRDLLGPLRSVLGVPGTSLAGWTLAKLLTYTGRYDEARAIMDEVIPLARRLTGAEFLGPVLISESELEEARGNLAAARQAIREAVEVELEEPNISHWIQAIVPACRLLPEGEAQSLIDAPPSLPKDPAHEAPLIEARAILDGDPGGHARAAEIFASLELPYDEARCRIQAGQLDRAHEIIERYGLKEGPLGALLDREGLSAGR
jgi:adenylate cyclase